jgi:hypothetical protein
MTISRAAGEIQLKVSEIFIEDVGKGLARLDPNDVAILGASMGDVVEIKGEKHTVARISGIFPEFLGKTETPARTPVFKSAARCGSKKRPGKPQRPSF